MHTIHLDFAEKSKKSHVGTKTQAFLVGIDRNTRFSVAKAGRENAQAVIDFLSQKVFETTRVIITDQAKVFESKQLQNWAKSRDVKIQTGSPYNPQLNGLAERLIRDLKMFISMYPKCPGGCKVCLEAAVRHHNCSFCTTIGCSPAFALNKHSLYLPADEMLKITKNVRLKERKLTQDEEDRIRFRQKKYFDQRRPKANEKINEGLLVKRGLSIYVYLKRCKIQHG